MTNLLSLNMRVTLNETLSSANLPSSIGVSVSPRPMYTPVSVEPSSFSFRVDSKVCPPRSTVHFQVPVGSAARAGVPRPRTIINPKAATHHQAPALALVRTLIAVSPTLRDRIGTRGPVVLRERTGPGIDNERSGHRAREIGCDLPAHDAA